MESESEPTATSNMFQQVQQYFRLRNTSELETKHINQNMVYTKIISRGVCETTDTSCPIKIKESKMERKHRIPDAIGIGVAKCGTGSLMFLDCHPNVVFRDMEARSV